MNGDRSTAPERDDGEDQMSDTWTVVRITASQEIAELVSDALHASGVAAVEEIPAGDSGVVLRTSLGADASGTLEALHRRFPGLSSELEFVPKEVADTWRSHASPTAIDDDLWLVPAWQDSPDPQRSIRIEPFDTFGLGNHPSTVGALRLARQMVAPGSRLHDHGTGSGVIAVAMRATHGCVVSVDDIHPGSRAAVEHNARLNDIDVPTWCDEIPAGVDVIVANILAPVLKEHAQVMSDRVQPNGLIVLAGMRDTQVAEVMGCYLGVSLVASVEIDGWTAVVLRKH